MDVEGLEVVRARVAELTAPRAQASEKCSHLDQIALVTPDAEGCSQCIALGDTWVNLRLCLTCGQVGCCDDSKNKHASKHYAEVGHPIIMSYQPGEDWVWCYSDETRVA